MVKDVTMSRGSIYRKYGKDYNVYFADGATILTHELIALKNKLKKEGKYDRKTQDLVEELQETLKVDVPCLEEIVCGLAHIIGKEKKMSPEEVVKWYKKKSQADYSKTYYLWQLIQPDK